MLDEKKSELEVLFPYKDVDIGDGKTVKMHPIPLPELEKVLDALSNVAQLVTKKLSHTEIGIQAGKDVLRLLPLCIDVPLSTIPSTAAPYLLEVLLEQNLTDAVIKKWQVLVSNLPEEVGVGAGAQSILKDLMKSSPPA